MANETSGALLPGSGAVAGRERTGRRLLRSSLVALGIVFGDIGTSPLYAFRESFHGHALAPTHENVMGVLSLITWSLLIVVSLKYLLFVLRADNHGEGGILALTALVTRMTEGGQGSRRLLVLLGLVGAALLYGDGMITPAISVLSAVEGLTVAAPAFLPYVVPLTVVILFLLFALQRRGTAVVGRIFGPVMVAWFVVLAALGVAQVIGRPVVIGALDPRHALAFLAQHGLSALLVLGSVFLVVTGSEALYADIGHFGKRPIRLPWFAFVLPALLLNYWGQGALVYADPAAAANPFFLLAPTWGLYPLIILSTLATVIASQALISGVFSLTRQAVQFGYVPRLTITHTSGEEIGQVYVPAANWALMLASVLLVIGFGASANLAAAYGIAVSTSMVLTTVLLGVVMRERWHWSWPLVGLAAGGFLAVDLLFFSGNIAKVPDGGWVPLAVGAGLFTLMTTWKKGRRILAGRLAESYMPAARFLAQVREQRPLRVPGIAVYMSGTPYIVPAALHHNFSYNKVLHERILLLAVRTEAVPRVGPAGRRELVPLGDGLFQGILHYGFMQSPDVPRDLRGAWLNGKRFDRSEVTYFLGRETVLPSTGEGMALWRERIFAFMSRNAQPATAFFGLPPARVVELGTQVEI